jgi:hypothetical protein
MRYSRLSTRDGAGDDERVALFEPEEGVQVSLHGLAVSLHERVRAGNSELLEQRGDGGVGLDIYPAAVHDDFHRLTRPVIGLEGLATSDSSMSPARRAERPASTAILNA